MSYFMFAWSFSWFGFLLGWVIAFRLIKSLLR